MSPTPAQQPTNGNGGSHTVQIVSLRAASSLLIASAALLRWGERSGVPFLALMLFPFEIVALLALLALLVATALGNLPLRTRLIQYVWALLGFVAVVMFFR
jgi:hypothetical protein